MRPSALATLLLAAGSAWAQHAFDLERLMQRLAQTPSSEVRYIERKYSALLSEPVVSSGTLAYMRPDVVEKRMEKPRVEGFRIAGEELMFTRKAGSRRIALSSEPLLAAFAASLRGVLAGDAVVLREHFRLVLTGTEADWTLEMTPVDATVTRYVEGIVVSGRAGRVARVEVRESGGDRSVLTVNEE